MRGQLRRYRLPLALCALLQRCLLSNERTGRWTLRTLAGDERAMGLLFEEYVRTFLGQEQAAFRVTAPTMIWSTEGDTQGPLPGLRTDVVMRRPGHAVIVEEKCCANPLLRATSVRARVRADNLCQLVAYLDDLRRSLRDENAWQGGDDGSEHPTGQASWPPRRGPKNWIPRRSETGTT